MDIQKVSKAIAGAIAAVLAGFLVKWLGTLYTPELNDAVRSLVDVIVSGVLGYIVVWSAPKNKE